MENIYEENVPLLPKDESQGQQMGAVDEPIIQENIFEGYSFPSLVSRIKALFIDLVVLMTVFSIAAIIIEGLGNAPSWARAIIFIFMLYIYDPLFVSFWGGTIGHKLLKLEVKSFKNPDINLSLPYAFLRFFTKGILGWISFLTVSGNKHKRAIHDLFSGSVVLYK